MQKSYATSSIARVSSTPREGCCSTRYRNHSLVSEVAHVLAHGACLPVTDEWRVRSLRPRALAAIAGAGFFFILRGIRPGRHGQPGRPHAAPPPLALPRPQWRGRGCSEPSPWCATVRRHQSHHCHGESGRRRAWPALLLPDHLAWKDTHPPGTPLACCTLPCVRAVYIFSVNGRFSGRRGNDEHPLGTPPPCCTLPMYECGELCTLCL